MGARRVPLHLPSSHHPTQHAVAHREGRWSHREQAPGAWQRPCSAPLPCAGTCPHALGTPGTRLPCSHWDRCSGTSRGGHCGRCPGSDRGWRDRGCTWPGHSVQVGLWDGRHGDTSQWKERWECVLLWALMWKHSLWCCWEQSLSKGLCTRQWDSHRFAQSPGKCHQSGKRTEVTWFLLLHKAAQQKSRSHPDSQSIALLGAQGRIWMDSMGSSHLGTQISWQGW